MIDECLHVLLTDQDIYQGVTSPTHIPDYLYLLIACEIWYSFSKALYNWRGRRFIAVELSDHHLLVRRLIVASHTCRVAHLKIILYIVHKILKP